MRNKRIYLLVLLFLPLFIGAQKVIQMEKENGVFKISCTVNGAKMKMIFDTGASNVSLSLPMANYLFENDYITKDDIIGTGNATVADGAIVNTTIVNLRDIEISGIHIKDVRAMVTEGQNVPLLFGQSAIKKLGSYTINGTNLILNNHLSNFLTDKEVEDLIEAIIKSVKNEQYFQAIENLKRMQSADRLGPYGYSTLARCYVITKQYQLAIDAAELGLSQDGATNEDKLSLYNWLSMAYDGIEDYPNSIKYSELSLQFETDKMGLYYAYCQIGFAYEKLNNIYQAEINYKKAAKCIMELRQIDAKDIFNGKVNDKELGSCLYSLASIRMDDYDNSYMRVYAVLGAMCNNRECKSICSRFYIDYRNDAKKMYKHYISQGFLNLFD